MNALDMDKEIRLLRTIADLRIQKAALLEALEGKLSQYCGDCVQVRRLCEKCTKARAAIALARGGENVR